ncbi:MAG: fibronectin type III domain-containing protein, partial [Planctomycetaceae bacterium]|nr:fibronectin type III domain-containing protein [Planctomycetaceae bacterium]
MSLFRKLFSNSKISNSLKKNVSKRSLRMEPLEDRQMLSVYGVEISATDFNNISNSYKELNIGQYSDYEGTQTAKNLFVVDANFLENSTMSDLNALLAQQTSGQRVLLFNVGNSQETFAWEGMNINGGNFSIIAGTTGNGSMTLDSTGHQAFNITNTGSLGSTVKIGGLTITNSEGANGGAINLTTVTPVTTVNSLTLSRVTLKNNTATGMGGGIYQDRGNVTLYNVLMVQNTAGSFGGALAVANSMNAVTTIINSTLYNNNSNTPYSGIHFNGTGDNSKITIANSIITNGYGKNDVYFNDTGVAGSRTLVNSLTTSSSSISFIPQNVQLANNKTGDPRFVNVAGGNYTPLLDSPAHNAGDKAYLGQLQYDILGNPRVIDGQVDMGAFQNLGIPDTPTGLTVTAIGANTINLSWDAVGGAESYNVYRYKGTEWVLAAANVTDTSFTQKGLTPGAPYAFCVTAVKGNAESAKSVFVRATTLAMSSTATATATGTRSIDLSWSAVKGAASYDVYRYKNNAWLLVANVAGTTFTQNGLTPGAPYAFRVIARDADGGEITRSATIHAMTLLGLTATATAPKTIDLSWSAVVHAASYDVYRYGNNAWNLVATVAGTTFTQKGLTPDAPYAFRVIARDADGGEMTRSATIQARTLPLLSASTILEATPTALMSSALMSSAAQPTSGFVAAVTDLEAIPTGTRSIDLSWSAVEGATSYDVYRWKGTAWLYVTNVAGTTFTQNGLTPGAPYAFYVVARNGDSVSERTATVRATTFCLPPANLVATATGSRTVQLTWDAVAGATSYDVYRWSNGSWLLVENVSGTTFDERAVLTPNAPYSYSVIAKNVAGDSARSALAQVTTDPRGALANIVDLVFADDLFDSANVVNLGKVDELCTNDGTTTTNKDFAFVPENNFSYTVVTDSDSASMT